MPNVSQTSSGRKCVIEAGLLSISVVLNMTIWDLFDYHDCGIKRSLVSKMPVCVAFAFLRHQSLSLALKPPPSLLAVIVLLLGPAKARGRVRVGQPGRQVDEKM
jgi:hypothetical protein